MKKLLIPVLMLGISVNSFSQIDLTKKITKEPSDKWVITPVPTMKGVLGRLDINFPADVERNILIYQQTDNQFLRSVSRNDKIYTIAPGQYRFTLTNVPVDNVPIQKGHETRLKAGFLDIVSEGDWHLYDETKVKAYTSGNKPKKLPLPVGRYQIKLGGQFYPVVIKDGKTVEDSSPVEDGTPVHEKVKIMETDTWVITPMNKLEIVLTKGRGRLNLNFNSALWQVYIGGNGVNKDISSSDGLDYYDLPAGEYLVRLNLEYTGEKIPIRQDCETRIKHGFIEVLTQCDYAIHFGSSYGIKDKGPKTYVSPVGTGVTFYTSSVGGIHTGSQFFIIRNGITESTKVGIINVASGNWSLSNLAGETCLNSYLSGSSIVLAIGKYKLWVGGNTNATYTVEIKGGETLQY